MPKGYWIAHVDVADLDQYKLYVAANAEPFRRFGAKFLARGGKFQSMEGASRSRNVVLEFESYQKALDCYNSPDYQEAIKLRAAVAQSDLTIVEGYDGVQPGG